MGNKQQANEPVSLFCIFNNYGFACMLALEFEFAPSGLGQLFSIT